MKTLFAPDHASVPSTPGGGGGGAVLARAAGPSPSRDTAAVLDRIQCEFHDYPRAAIVDAMESCLLELEGEVQAQDLENCMRLRLRKNDHWAALN